MDEKIVDQIKNSSFFFEWRDYILMKIAELNSVSGMKNFSNEAAGEEVKVREKTISKLKELLIPFTETPRTRITTDEAIRRAKKNVGL